jgi:hypothetical protein
MKYRLPANERPANQKCEHKGCSNNDKRVYYHNTSLLRVENSDPQRTVSIHHFQCLPHDGVGRFHYQAVGPHGEKAEHLDGRARYKFTDALTGEIIVTAFLRKHDFPSDQKCELEGCERKDQKVYYARADQLGVEGSDRQRRVSIYHFSCRARRFHDQAVGPHGEKVTDLGGIGHYQYTDAVTGEIIRTVIRRIFTKPRFSADGIASIKAMRTRERQERELLYAVLLRNKTAGELKSMSIEEIRKLVEQSANGATKPNRKKPGIKAGATLGDTECRLWVAASLRREGIVRPCDVSRFIYPLQNDKHAANHSAGVFLTRHKHKLQRKADELDQLSERDRVALISAAKQKLAASR